MGVPSWAPKRRVRRDFIVNWKRITAWSAIVFAALLAVGFAAGLTMQWWEIYGATIEVAVENARLVRRIAYVVVAVLLYWRFALGVERLRFAHVVAVFVGMQLISFVVDVGVFRAPFDLDAWALARGFASALAGWVLAEWQVRRKPRVTSTMPTGV